MRVRLCMRMCVCAFVLYVDCFKFLSFLFNVNMNLISHAHSVWSVRFLQNYSICLFLVCFVSFVFFPRRFPSPRHSYARAFNIIQCTALPVFSSSYKQKRKRKNANCLFRLICLLVAKIMRFGLRRLEFHNFKSYRESLFVFVFNGAERSFIIPCLFKTTVYAFNLLQ